MDITQYAVPELSIMIPVLLAIGTALKTAPAKYVANDLIPLILCIFSVALTTVFFVANSLFIYLTQGVIYWFIAWTLYGCGKKIVKQPGVLSKKGDNNDALSDK